MKFYSFHIEVNEKHFTETREGKNFQSAFMKLFTEGKRRYKSFNSVKYIGEGDRMSEAIMAQADYETEHPELFKD
jgi:hypothetical protein